MTTEFVDGVTAQSDALGFEPAVVKAVPLLARTAGLLAHLAEEQQQPIGFLMAGRAEQAITYEPPSGRGG